MEQPRELVPRKSNLKLRAPGGQKWNGWKMKNSLIEKGLQANRQILGRPASDIPACAFSGSWPSLRLHHLRGRRMNEDQIDSMATVNRPESFWTNLPNRQMLSKPAVQEVRCTKCSVLWARTFNQDIQEVEGDFLSRNR
jgi:hypothetical protein